MSTHVDMEAQNWSSTALNPVGLIVRQRYSNNLETPFNQLGEFITPPELFYIRSHFPTPELGPATFRLSIRGAVGNELSLSHADLRAVPSWKCVARLECAGTAGYSERPPPQQAAELGPIGNAEWTGAPLSVLFENARLADRVCDIVLEGADRGVPE
jgi:DMSO/TMAO reductase YedYZ molybdopterin-dependent catalytic subunit